MAFMPPGPSLHARSCELQIATDSTPRMRGASHRVKFAADSIMSSSTCGHAVWGIRFRVWNCVITYCHRSVVIRWGSV